MLILSGRLSQFFYLDLIASCFGLFLRGTRLNPVCARRLCDRQDGLCPHSRPPVVHLADLLTVRRKQRHRHIYASLLDHYMKILTRDRRDFVGMRLAAGKLSLNRLAWFQRNTLLSAWRRAAFTGGDLRRRRLWPRACDSRRPDP